MDDFQWSSAIERPWIVIHPSLKSGQGLSGDTSNLVYLLKEESMELSV